MEHCQHCQQPIEDSHCVEVSGLYWHRGCFTCRLCKQMIDSRYTLFNQQPFHAECLVCPGCRKTIKSRYINYKGMPWHSKCYQNQYRFHCNVCDVLLGKEYLIDFWGNMFCQAHQNYSRCSSCRRLVCERITGGGMSFSDGLVICNLCNVNGVTDTDQGERILGEMRNALASVGMDLSQSPTPLTLCSRDELRKASRHNFHNERPILGLVRWSTTFSRGQPIARKFQDVLIQRHLPEEHFRTVVIHELTHAWLFYQNYPELPLEIEEGLCVMMEYVWLKSQKSREAEFRRQLIERSDDPIYGKGFRRIRQALKRMPLRVLLQYIFEKRTTPSRLQAFFYH